MAPKEAGAKKPWGAVNGADKTKDAAPPPQLAIADAAGRQVPASSGGMAAVKIEDIDLSLMEVVGPVKDGQSGDKYVELKYNGQRLVIEFCKLPDFVRCPFKAGPAKTKEGAIIGDAWSIAVELTQEQYDKWLAFEQWLYENTKHLKDQAFPPKAGKPGKEPKGMSDDDYEGKFNSLLRPADVDRGYKATLRLAVQHEPVDKQNKPRTMPKIFKAHLKTHPATGKLSITRPILGKIDDLDRNSAIVPVAALSRGVYFGGTGWGMKFPLATAYVLTNMSSNSGPAVDTSGVDILDEETPDDDNVPPAKRIRASDDVPFQGGAGEMNQFGEHDLLVDEHQAVTQMLAGQ